MRQIFAAGKKSNHWPAKLRNVIAYRSPKHWIFRFECIEQRTLSDRSLNLKFRFAIDVRERAQMRWENDANHCQSSKFQAPTSREIPIAKLQANRLPRVARIDV